MSRERGRTTRPDLNGREKGEKEEQSGLGISEKGKTNKEEDTLQVSVGEKQNSTGKGAVLDRWVPGNDSCPRDSRQGTRSLTPASSKEAALQESTEQERPGWRGWQR